MKVVKIKIISLFQNYLLFMLESRLQQPKEKSWNLRNFFNKVFLNMTVIEQKEVKKKNELSNV